MQYNNEYYKRILDMLVLRIWRKFGTQKKFAEEIGIDPGNLSKFLQGKYFPSSRVFVEMCLVLGVGIFTPIETKEGLLYPTLVSDPVELATRIYYEKTF